MTVVTILSNFTWHLNIKYLSKRSFVGKALIKPFKGSKQQQQWNKKLICKVFCLYFLNTLDKIWPLWNLWFNHYEIYDHYEIYQDFLLITEIMVFCLLFTPSKHTVISLLCSHLLIYGRCNIFVPLVLLEEWPTTTKRWVLYA